MLQITFLIRFFTTTVDEDDDDDVSDVLRAVFCCLLVTDGGKECWWCWWCNSWFSISHKKKQYECIEKKNRNKYLSKNSWGAQIVVCDLIFLPLLLFFVLMLDFYILLVSTGCCGGCIWKEGKKEEKKLNLLFLRTFHAHKEENKARKGGEREKNQRKKIIILRQANANRIDDMSYSVFLYLYKWKVFAKRDAHTQMTLNKCKNITIYCQHFTSSSSFVVSLPLYIFLFFFEHYRIEFQSQSSVVAPRRR